MEILYRQRYIEQIEKYLGKDYIIVLVGQRRVGKSYTLKMIRSLKEKDSNNNIIFVDKEKEQLRYYVNSIRSHRKQTKHLFSV